MIPILPVKASDPLPERILSRTQVDSKEVRKAVRSIIDDVKIRGDLAVLTYTKMFDKVKMSAKNMRVTGDEINSAYKKVSPEVLTAMHRAIDNIRAYHERQKRQTWLDLAPRTVLGQIVTPIQNVGIYIPGGTAPLFSSVMMNSLPAVVAGVERIAMVTPPRADGSISPEILVAAYECGVKEIYKVGGAQAIAALAYGTETITAVDKIVGPGNIYVSNAKREVFGVVGIDMIAGPSEILIVADSSARPDWVAADMLSQAEHDALSCSVLITDDKALADAVVIELEKQIVDLPREDIATEALKRYGAILLVENMIEAMEISNKIAPEHLELCVREPFGLLGWVKNAGACFLGHFSPEPMGDYFAGPNHVLPTSGTARFFSPLSVDDFTKKTSVIRFSKTSLAESAQDVALLARSEQLEAHARAIDIRIREHTI